MREKHPHYPVILDFTCIFENRNKIHFNLMGKYSVWEHNGLVVEPLTQDQGAAVRAWLVSLCCVLEQDALVLA